MGRGVCGRGSLPFCGGVVGDIALYSVRLLVVEVEVEVEDCGGAIGS